jgi:hypothetical protein
MRQEFSDEELQGAGILSSEKTKSSTTQGTQSHRVDLTERLKLKPAFNNPASEERKPGEETDQEDTESSTGTKTQGAGKTSATFSDGKGEASEETQEGFEGFAKNIEDQLSSEDAIEIAEMIVSIGNIGRMVFLPGLYEGFMYPGQERNDIRDVVRRSIINKQTVPSIDPETGFNDYDKELYAKWPKLQAVIQNVSFTEPEIKTLAKYLARQIGEMTVSVWVNKHMWLLYWLYLETLHAKDIVGARAQGWFNKKFSGK